MTKFDVYVDEIAQRRAARRNESLNRELLYRLEHYTKGQAVENLYATLTFIGGVSDVLCKENKELAVN